jgi:hypothetical protein
LFYTNELIILRAPVFLQANALGPNAFVPHVVVLVLGLIFAYIHVPETRGKSLEQIEKEMEAE